MSDFIGKDDSGRGIVNILTADKLMASPKLYATFLLWLLSELFEQLPEIGDPDKPVLAFFFDEAHKGRHAPRQRVVGVALEVGAQRARPTLGGARGAQIGGLPHGPAHGCVGHTETGKT